MESTEEVRGDVVDDDDNGLTISFIMGSDDYVAPLDMVAPNDQTIIMNVIHTEPGRDQQDVNAPTDQHQTHTPGFNHQDTASSSQQPGPRGLVVPFGSSRFVFIKNLEVEALQLMAAGQPVSFPPPIFPNQLLLTSGPNPVVISPPNPVRSRHTDKHCIVRHQASYEKAFGRKKKVHCGRF